MRACAVPSLWPGAWPLPLQVVLMCVLAEALSYWQHRLFHRVPFLWRFHALHHSGERLNMVRAGRFHFADIGPGAFFVFLPLVLLGAPGAVVAWSAALTGVLGLLQHANLRMRTPAWADRLVCTPAVHRFHHSREPRENDGNFGTIVMVFDVLFACWWEARMEHSCTRHNQSPSRNASRRSGGRYRRRAAGSGAVRWIARSLIDRSACT